MKKQILLFILIVIPFALYSQNNHITKVTYDEVITSYNIVTTHQADLYLSQKESYYTVDFSTENQVENKEMVEDENVVFVTLGDEPEEEEKRLSNIYIDKMNQTLCENRYEVVVLNKTFSIHETLPEFDWNIQEETKKIGDYLCKKATATFRGRTWEVWYTEEIPVSAGPWKFNGLPGLILEAHDKTDNIYNWYATKITSVESFDFNQAKNQSKNYENITYLELDKKIIETKKAQLNIVNTRMNSTRAVEGVTFETRAAYTTEEWKEPTNEQRKDVFIQ